jgi:aldose 1-epimerase
MSFQVTSRQRTFPFRPQPMTVWRLADEVAGCCAEIAPEMGCNCYDWRVREGAAEMPLLYADPEVFPGGRPTRSGIPVLFPYVNRLRGGTFTWEGKKYQLPLTDASGKHSIHGFACRHPWRVTASGADATAAWLTAEFQASKDAGEDARCWPADYVLTLTFRLAHDRLRLEAVVDNRDRGSLPFGLGFHPYYQLAVPDAPVAAPARTFWELDGSLPTGKRLPVDAARDVNVPRAANTLKLDDVLSELPAGPVNAEGLVLRGSVGRVELWAAPVFRELVAFTPPHGKAVCLEPYTCTTDAANLQARGIDAGWLTLPAGQQWRAVFEMVVQPR